MCTHSILIGTNNGMSCASCGEAVSGFGNGLYTFGKECIHDWYGTKDMKLCVCTWCETTKPNPNFISIEEAEAAAEGAFCD